ASRAAHVGARAGRAPARARGGGDTVDAVRRIADAVLYEGHVLWPYRRSALKNRERWTFGRLHPQGHGEATTLQAQLLLETDRVARLDVTLRFLHLVERRVHRRTPAGMQPVDTLDVEGQ